VTRVEENVPLAEWCTLGVGGPARWFVEARSESDVIDALSWARSRHTDLFVLGGGSNIVNNNAGLHALVVRIALEGVEQRIEGRSVIWRVGAGEPWDAFVRSTVRAQCAGLECLSGIPGLVGGTPIQNVGAYGQDVSGTIQTVRAIDRQSLEMLNLTAAECGFAYRTSRFKHRDANRFVVTGVAFALTPGGAPTLAYADVVKYFHDRSGTPSLDEVRCAILDIRARKGMVIQAGNPANQSVGSFFVNPIVTRQQFDRVRDAIGATDEQDVPHYPTDDDRVKIPAAWLIEQAGYSKGHTVGNVGISPFQAQGLINRGGASSAEVIALAAAVKRAVWSDCEVMLVPEPVFVGFGDDPNVRWLLEGSPTRH